MFIVLITWGIMLLLFIIYGCFANYFIRKLEYCSYSTKYDMIWFGIIIVTVYAQLFSIFYKVGRLSIYIIVCLAMLLVILMRREYISIAEDVIGIIRGKKMRIFVAVIFFVVVVAGSLFTVRMPQHYDTYLYHAQNIRWIENYGLVNGLGNFHNRFAYNSSFMCLQALFSFSWCIRQSLHTLNGFLWCFMLLFSLLSLKVYNEKVFFFSDLLRLLMLFYLCNSQTLQLISSPHTDLMTMLLVIYIIIRWVELLENEVKSYVPYGVLCMLGVFAVTIKLSAVLILVLTLKPAIQLFYEKKWKNIIIFIGIASIIIIPFLIRNVLISGYLVYPYTTIDLFDVDWKMPVSQVDFDKHEIIAWGRMLNNVERYEEPITTWLPIWFENNSKFNRSVMLINLILVFVSPFIFIKKIIKKNYDESLILLSFSLLFLGWLLTAPLLRYGIIYMFLQPLLYLSIICEKIFIILKREWIYTISVIYVCVFIGMINLSLTNMEIIMKGGVIWPMDYSKAYATIGITWNGIEIYLPKEGDQVSYHDFPSTPYYARLGLIELRGEDIKDGFRIKEEYKGRNISTYGNFLD